MEKPQQVQNQDVSAEASIAKLVAVHASLASDAATKISRRGAMGALAASALPLPALAFDDSAMTAPVQENPELIEAHAQLKAARAELAAATEAMEWLVDEWRHLWPLAPEELLGCANADRGYGSDDAERDIVGNYLRRDTSVLLKRLSPKLREKMPATCFSIMTPDEAQERIDFWTRRVPTGRTEKALERNRAERDRFIREYQHKLVLARQYQAETDRLRKLAGVNEAKQRIEDAKRDVYSARDKVSLIPARTVTGLMIKADAIKTSEVFEAAINYGGGTLAEMARFVDAIINFIGRASA